MYKNSISFEHMKSYSLTNGACSNQSRTPKSKKSKNLPVGPNNGGTVLDSILYAI